MRETGTRARTGDSTATADARRTAARGPTPEPAAGLDATGTASAADAVPAQAARAVHGSRAAALGAFAALAALTLLCIAWEWRLAPLHPGGSALVLKALPLAAALPGVLRRRLYTLQWASMLVLLYFAEGIVRGMTDPVPGNRLGWVEVALALVFFGCALVYVAPFKRAARRDRRRGRGEA